MTTALYRRYRPETFTEMIGQAQVTEPLMTALRSSKLGHAYLFSGPRGCGKTTSARILARCLNCHEGPSDTPCGKCDSCIELGRDGGGSLDVIEIDAASHGGVEDARELRERAVFAPARDRFKVFIIDEAHMVSREGFNALLKIVEEPPEHVKFVFATTEPEKVIGTIRSRTHHYPFRLVAPAPLIEYVKQLCVAEGVEAEDGVLALAVKAGGGSVRDTLSIIDQLIAGSDSNKISYDRAVGLLGYTPEDLLDEMINAFGDKDAAASIQKIDSVIQSGQDPRRFVEDLLERFRDLIVVNATDVSGASSVLRDTSEEQLQRLFEQASKFDSRTLSQTADIVNATLESMVGATAPKLQLELMVARVLVVFDVKPDQSQAVPAKPVHSKTVQSKPSVVRESPVVSEPPVMPEPPAAPFEPAEQPPISFSEAASSARAFLRGTAEDTTEPEFSLELLKENWGRVKDTLTANNPMALEALKNVKLANFLDGKLFVEYEEPSQLEDFKQLAANPLRETITNIFGVQFSYIPNRQSKNQHLVETPGSHSTAKEPDPEPEPVPDSEVEPEPVPEIEQDYEPAIETKPESESESESEPEPEPEPEPEIIRYGEAVVRAQLGAKFLKEEPIEEAP